MRLYSISRSTSNQHRTDKLAPVLIGVMLLGGLVSPSTSLAEATVFGPGIAGQIHALAYDPARPDTIYAGGDTPGAFFSDDGGYSWSYFNDGFENDDLTRSSYVDDLLVIPSGATGQGIYAATHAGIYFRDFTDNNTIPDQVTVTE